ncbi:unnamed protein product [Pedinophyceae sp. YPF-701]|nr:unnamed protein product [Pedinophyceae sp. YPF-701]
MSSGYQSWADAGRAFSRTVDFNATQGLNADQGRFDFAYNPAQQASMTYDAKQGRYVHGIRARPARRVLRVAFEAEKQKQSARDIDEWFAKPGGRRHLSAAHAQLQMHNEQRLGEDARDKQRIRRCQNTQHRRLFNTSGDNCLSPEPGGDVDDRLQTWDGTYLHSKPRPRTAHPLTSARYAARYMYDDKRREDNEFDDKRMAAMQADRQRHVQHVEQQRSGLMDLVTEYPHGIPKHIERKLRGSGLNFGDTTSHSNMTAPFTRPGYRP